MISLDELLKDSKRAGEIQSEAIPPLLGNLEHLKAILWARVTMRTEINGTSVPANRLLDAKEAAARLGVSLQYVYKNASDPDKFPFRVEAKCRRLLFSEQGLESYLRKQLSGKQTA